jgi:hypothetical protein
MRSTRRPTTRKEMRMSDVDYDRATAKADLDRILAEHEKLIFEARKLRTEEEKMRTETKWHPVVVAGSIFTAGGAVTAAIGGILALYVRTH